MRLLAPSIGRPRILPSRCRIATATGRRHLTNNGFFRVSDEVREALNSKKPVVALETTIYTHGFPYPENVALASLLESVVRTNGGIPATIGILDGVARVGMDPEELIRLASSAGKANTMKLSRRDLGYVCGMRLTDKSFNGGTTISGTMLLAHLAGIKIFGTGGLGGVHRGAESSMDISADLTELGRTPVTVISSGCKSFLDIPRTIEYLETEGVGVGTFADGRQGNVDFPAFWSRDSGVKSPTTIADEIEAAAVIYAQHALQISSGLLFANPVPTDFAIPKDEMDVIIAEALKQAEASNISGKDNTPFVLAKIKELSKGKSIPANRALIESNVKRATIVARELAILEAKQEQAQG
jgi:pseudouridine-5'-phosphate glycosidase/pseudouridine kinase